MIIAFWIRSLYNYINNIKGSDIMLEFPKEQNKNEYYCGDNSYLNLYYNASTDEVSFCLNALQDDGYRIVSSNEKYGNCFVALEKEDRVTLYYTPNDRQLRVTKEPLTNKLPVNAAFEDKGCQTTFYCFESDHTLIDCGMCLLIQCSDYSFFVVDSGHYLQMNDNDRLYKFMRERTPEGQQIVINGWLITHTHTDHVSKFLDFLKYNTENVRIEGFYLNLLPESYVIDDWGREEQYFNELTRNTLKKLTSIPKCKLHSGQSFKLRNLEIDVLCTHEDVYPEKIKDFNDSSSIVMVTVENTKIFIPGDASGLESDILERRFGENLKCDIAQIAHHGHFGLSENVYKLLNAKTVVFPITRIKYSEELPKLKANRTAIGIAERSFISSDGTVKIPLPYNKDTITRLPDETFEDFKKIKRLWGYDYTDEYKKELYDLFIENGGRQEEMLLPINYIGSFLD